MVLQIPSLPGEIWSKIGDLMTSKEWASGLGCTCKALHNLEFERLQLSLLEENLSFDQNQNRKHPVYLGLRWMTKHFNHSKVLDLDLSCNVGLQDGEHRAAMELDVLDLREGDGPHLIEACRVSYRNHSGACIQDLLDWMVARMDHLKFLDVNYHFAVFPAVFPALSNLKCLRFMMNSHLEARTKISPELLLMPKLEELSISDHGIECDYNVEDELFTAKNFPEDFDLRRMSALLRIGFEGITTGTIRLPPNCQAFVKTQTMDLERPFYMQKLNADLAEIWVDSKEHVYHFVQTNESPNGFDMGFLPHLSCVRCLEFHGEHERRPDDWPMLDHFSVDLAAFNLPFLESLRVIYSSDQPVTVNIALPRKFALRCLEVAAIGVMLLIEDAEAMGSTLEKVAIAGTQLQSSVDMNVIWERMRSRGFRCFIAECQGSSQKCWYTRQSGESLLSYDAACHLPLDCGCGLCFACWSAQGRVKMHG